MEVSVNFLRERAGRLREDPRGRPARSRHLFPNIFLSAHVGLEGGRDTDAAVGLLVRLEERDHDAGRGDSRVVERMHEFHLAIFVAVADVGPAGLPVMEVRTRVRLAVASLAGHPAFDIRHLYLAVAHVTGADIDDTIRNFQGLQQFFRVVQQFVIPAHRLCVIGATDDVLLHLVKLVDTEDAARILTISTRLLAEARAETYKLARQLFGLQNFVLKHARDRYLRRADQEEILTINLIDLVTPLRELAVADETEVMRHRGYDQWRETFFGDAIHCEIHQC